MLLGLKTTGADQKTLRFVRETLKQSLSIYTQNVSDHLKSLPYAKRVDSTLATTEEKYHLYMLEIELVNRIYREEFKRSEYKFALIAHCLRDFRPDCRSVKGDIEAVCRGCTEDCFIHLGSVLLEKYGIKPYISVEMDQERLFKKTQARAPQHRCARNRLYPGAGHGHEAVHPHRHPTRWNSIECKSMCQVDVAGSRDLFQS